MLDKNIHKNTLVKILKDIYTDSYLGPLLGFKGGTAAYLFYDLDRFSVDLDFDLLDESKEKEVFSRVEEIIREYGIIKDKKTKKHTIFLLLSYAKDAQNIKIEINKRSFGSKYDLKNYLGVSVLVMKREDMFANKLVALTERVNPANRDIYDIHYFLNNNWEINREIIGKRTNMDFADYLKKCIGVIENIPRQRLISGLGELISEKQKGFVKLKMKKDTIFLLKLMLENEKEGKRGSST